MIELPLIFVGGLLGSSHCVGMCGGFALLLGIGSRSVRDNILAQSMYSCGRIFTYAVLGACAGSLGARADLQFSTWVNVPAVLSLLAGVFLIAQGLSAAGFRFGITATKPIPGGGCLGGSIFATFLRSPHWSGKFLAGLLTGFLPCGLLYAFVALAAASGDLASGMGVMIFFGIGTVPLMITTGVGGSFLSLIARQRLLKLAAWCVVVTGVLTVARGVGFLRIPGQTAEPICPMCVELEVALPRDSEFGILIDFDPKKLQEFPAKCVGSLASCPIS